LVHPLNARQSFVALFTLRWPFAEIPCDAKKVFRRLTFFFDQQRQLLFLIRGEWDLGVCQRLSNLIFELIDRIAHSKLRRCRHCEQKYSCEANQFHAGSAFMCKICRSIHNNHAVGDLLSYYHDKSPGVVEGSGADRNVKEATVKLPS